MNPKNIAANFNVNLLTFPVQSKIVGKSVDAM